MSLAHDLGGKAAADRCRCRTELGGPFDAAWMRKAAPPTAAVWLATREREFGTSAVPGELARGVADGGAGIATMATDG
jgi:hypothetical protein